MGKRILKIIIILLGLFIVGIFTYEKVFIPKNKIAENPSGKVISLCYYDSVGTFPFVDKFWLRLDLNNEKVSGEFNSIPAQKDSKVGKFEGTVGPLDQKIMGRTADVWWNSLAEGMQEKEKLTITFGDGSANTSFSPSLTLGQVNCENYEEMKIVEKYLKDNIKTLAVDKAVLGGSWYVLGTNVIPATKSGEVVYEDGHIQSKATFTYTIENQVVKITSWKVGK